jgi:hypothetical protein
MVNTSLIVFVGWGLTDSPRTLELADAYHENVEPAVFDVKGIFNANPEQEGEGLLVVITGIGLTVTTVGMVSLLHPLRIYQAL